MQPGELPAETAERDAEHIAERMNVTVIQGTANYVARFNQEAGRMIFPEGADVMTFTAVGPRGDDPVFCVTFGRTAECGIDLDEPRIWTGVAVAGSTPTAAAYGSPSGAEAVVTTESGKTVSVMTVSGWAYAAWPTEWGQPQAVAFYDTSGNLVVNLNYPAIAGS